MIEALKTSLLTMMLTLWSMIALAQTTPGGTAGSTGGGTSSQTTTGAVGDTGTTMSWFWLVVAVIVVFGLLYYLFGRNRSTRI
ncbi:MAG TPA: hypothetical protein VEZ24_15730 [Microvirga sp.]|nr:hypothetical protein [Microvirga sp.]